MPHEIATTFAWLALHPMYGIAAVLGLVLLGFWLARKGHFPGLAARIDTPGQANTPAAPQALTSPAPPAAPAIIPATSADVLQKLDAALESVAAHVATAAAHVATSEAARAKLTAAAGQLTAPRS